jgi:hypothetical protein
VSADGYSWQGVDGNWYHWPPLEEREPPGPRGSMRISAVDHEAKTITLTCDPEPAAVRVARETLEGVNAWMLERAKPTSYRDANDPFRWLGRLERAVQALLELRERERG